MKKFSVKQKLKAFMAAALCFCMAASQSADCVCGEFTGAGRIHSF